MTKPYVIWDTRSELYWRPNGCGYTKNLWEAGVYEEKKALHIGNNKDPNRHDKAIPLEDKEDEINAILDKAQELSNVLEDWHNATDPE